MNDVLAWLQDHFPVANTIRTLVLLGIVLSARHFVLARLRHSEALANDLRRRWAAQIRLVTLLLLLLGLLMIWGTALKTFALSIVAIAAAIVIATKELIMCLSGTLLRASGRAYQIGDRVEIGAFRGDVIDQTLLTTSLLEVGPGTAFHQHTGRLIVVPNSTLLTTPVVNESFTDDYVLHAFSVALAPGDDWREAESALMQSARDECGSYLREAQRHMMDMVKREGLEALSVEPRVTIRMDGTGSAGSITLLVRVAVPARRKGRIEQAVLRRYLALRSQNEEREAASSD
ncbi:MAG: mechanosensitive ion channel family protein [Phycisphaerales bacterium]